MLIRLILSPADEHRSGANQMRQHLSFREHFRRGNAPAWDARQAGPRWRKMSATSTAGRDNGRASAGHLPQEVERAGHLADRVDRYAGVERRRVEFLMSQ